MPSNTLITKLRVAGVKMYAAVAEPKSNVPNRPPLLRPWEIDWKPPAAVLIGNEGAGLPEDIVSAADARVCIPQVAAATSAGLESLNAAMAATVLLYEAMRQRDFQR
jgi:tRNA G18 (ribose-2'-O)-methylase SpoU